MSRKNKRRKWKSNITPWEWSKGGKVKEKEEKEEEEHSPARPFRPHNCRTQYTVDIKDPTILITPEAYEDMFTLVDECDIEIGWLGIVERIGNDFLISKIFLPEQDCHSATTELDPDGLSKLYNDILAQPNGMEIAQKLLFWGHSHVNMDTGPSGQDDDQMEEFKKNGCEFFIRGILNKAGKMEFTVYYYNWHITAKDVPWCIYYATTSSRREMWKAEIKEKVSRISYGSYNYQGNSYYGGGGYYTGKGSYYPGSYGNSGAGRSGSRDAATHEDDLWVDENSSEPNPKIHSIPDSDFPNDFPM